MIKMSEEYVEIKIPKKLFEKIKKEVESSGDFKSVEEFVEFVLSSALEESEEVYSAEEEEKVKERLKALGYL